MAFSRKNCFQMSEKNKALARHIFYEVWGSYYLDKVEKYFAANFINHPELPGMPQGSEGIKATVRMFASAFWCVEQVINDQMAEGDKVVTHWSTTFTHNGEFMGILATGKRIKATGITIYRFKDGKAAEGWTEYNSLEVMQQLGVIPVAAPSAG
jgi:predicted ester cyclase